ncbi:MAG: zinc ribbon domain-containing protein [Gemmataceae bacterium]
MSTTPTTADVLKEIHRLRRLIVDLEKKIADVPRQTKRRENDIEFHNNELNGMQETIKQLKVQASEGEKSIQSITNLIKKKRGQLGGLLSKKEFDALELEISHLEKQIGELEDKVLPLYDEITEKTDTIPGLEENLQAANAELKRYQAASQEQNEQLRAELERAREELKGTEATLPSGEFRLMYERLIRSKGEDSFAGVVKQSCQACYNSITAQMQNELLQGKLVFCSSCGRIIYLAE